MRARKWIFALFLTLLFAVLAEGAMAGVSANDIFIRASVSLNSSMTATFSASTNESTTISVVSCSLQKKENGAWKGAGSLTAPGSSTGTSYKKEKSYASSCTSGETYRVVATFKAGTESLTRYSNEVTY